MIVLREEAAGHVRGYHAERGGALPRLGGGRGSRAGSRNGATALSFRTLRGATRSRRAVRIGARLGAGSLGVCPCHGPVCGREYPRGGGGGGAGGGSPRGSRD